MNILILFVDKVSSHSIQELISEYEKRLKAYCNVNLITINVPKSVRKKSIDEQKREEQKLIEEYLTQNDCIVLLDEKGSEMTSVEFAKWMEKHLGRYKRMVFIIGGPYGFSEDLRQRYFKFSLSKMTFSHEMVRAIFLEQLYRAYSIINGQKYHHE